MHYAFPHFPDFTQALPSTLNAFPYSVFKTLLEHFLLGTLSLNTHRPVLIWVSQKCSVTVYLPLKDARYIGCSRDSEAQRGAGTLQSHRAEQGLQAPNLELLPSVHLPLCGARTLDS